MFGYVPDWPLLAAIVAAVAAGIAVWYSRRGAIASEKALRIQEREHRSTSLADELTDDQLATLRKAKLGWTRASVAIADGGQSTLRGTWKVGGVIVDPMSQENVWFVFSAPFLVENGLADERGITREGRALLRLNQDRQVPDRTLADWDRRRR